MTVDTSVIMAVILNGPSKERLIRLTDNAVLLSAPSLPWEVGNALTALFKRRRINLPQARAALASFAAIPLRLAEVDVEGSVAMAEKHGAYAYDAYIVECARRYQTSLLSLDEAQCALARREGVEVVEVWG